MTRSLLNLTGTTALLVVGTLGVGLADTPAPQWASASQLGGKERYLAHVSTDKPIYRDGEILYARAVLLEAHSHKPFTGGGSATVIIKGPKGNQVARGAAALTDSVAAFGWQIPSSAPGGDYVVRFQFPFLGAPPAERKVEIRAYRPPRLNSQIVFVRKGYGPGDTVHASLHVERAEGGFPAGAKVTVVARVDGSQIYHGVTQVDATGNCSTQFALPKHIRRGEGTLAMIIEDGGVVETASKTIPILLQTLDLSMYPEGGDLVVGLPSRVYFEARTPSDRPADLRGEVLDSHGHKVADVHTEHEGRGRFSITPRAGEHYALKILEPAGIAHTFALPAAKPAGTVLQSTTDTYGKRRPIRLRLCTTKSGTYTVTISQRDRQVASAKVHLPGLHHGRPVIVQRSLHVADDVDGVLVATVWNAEHIPVAERLVFRQPAKTLHVMLSTPKPSYATASKVTVDVTTTDAHGKPVSATVGLDVSDMSTLQMIEKRQQPPRLLPMVFLESDVRHLADAQVYLDPQNSKAALAVDLLLGTQGWRRFAFVHVNQFMQKFKDAAKRVLAFRTPPPAPLPAPRAWPSRMRDMIPSAAPRPGGRRPMEAERMEKRAVRRPRPAPRPHVAHARLQRQAIPRGGAMVRPFAGRFVQRRAWRPPTRTGGRMMWVREYAHQLSKDHVAGKRSDFAETVYWNAALHTDTHGHARVSFDLSDSVTSFRITADAFDKAGAVGDGTRSVRSMQPFYAEPKVPLQITSGDVVQLPVALVNSTARGLGHVGLTVSAAPQIRIGSTGPALTLGAGARKRRLVQLDTHGYVGESPLTVQANAGNYKDRVERKLDVQPLGFPMHVSGGGLLQKNGSAQLTVTIPQTIVAGSLKVHTAVSPSPMANLTQALSRLLRQPHGCFEQTSSTNYPLVMAQQYFMSHSGVDPQLIAKSRSLLETGYHRLLGFECKTHGYEWFGQDPGHEALTAFGLLEFTDMSKVQHVDEAMLQRTRAWLMDHRDGKGGFTDTRRALHTWLKNPDLHNGYITWAMLTSGSHGIGREAHAFVKTALREHDSYIDALGANIALDVHDSSAAKTLMERLAKAQNTDGWVDGAKVSIVGSHGVSLHVETTSLATLAWLHAGGYTGQVQHAIQWLASTCDGGRYGSTQSTVLALRAILAYDAQFAHAKSPGSLQLYVDGRQVGSAVRFDARTKKAIELPDAAGALSPGTHTLRLAMRGGAQMPFTFRAAFFAQQPDSSRNGRVALQTRLVDTRLREGKVTEANVTVRNLSGDALPMSIAIVGIPGGLEVRHEQLEQLKKAGRIAAYEVRGRDVVLYWRQLEPHQVVQLPLSLVAAIPGIYTGPASRAYEYYTDEAKRWAPPLHVSIDPRQ